MPTVGDLEVETAPEIVGAWRRWVPELVLAAVASAVFLGCLGSMGLWGKREQRAVAESIDTIDNDHWLVAEIQARKRLEKPPLPRWTAAGLIALTGRREIWLLRLPAAASALGIVALVYGLGRRIGGREVGLVAGLAICSTFIFITEMRQAGNDGPLAFFTTLAIYAAWRRLHGGPADEPPGLPADRPGARGWAVLMFVAMGLGFLCKGPIAQLLVALAILPYLVCTRRFRVGSGLLFDSFGLVLMLVLAMSWPVPVALSDPNAVGVWLLEMGQKAGSAGITHHRKREFLVTEWPGMAAPWTVLALIGLAAPWLRRGPRARPGLWLPWWWAMGNLAMFCLWSVAKPNYYVPCLPAVALLAGTGWTWLSARAREPGGGPGAIRVIYGHWAALLVVAAILPAVIWLRWPQFIGLAALASASTVLGVVGSVWAWRRGAVIWAVAPMATAMAAVVLVGYGLAAPRLDDRNSHRALAATLDRVLPPEVETVMFYRELDEGLWYYLRDRRLVAVPGSQPEYNLGFDMVRAAASGQLIWDEVARRKAAAQVMVDWLEGVHHESPYILIRADDYDFLRADFEGLVTPVYREPELDRNPLMLLRRNEAGRSESLAGWSGENDPTPPRR